MGFLEKFSSDHHQNHYCTNGKFMIISCFSFAFSIFLILVLLLHLCSARLYKARASRRRRGLYHRLPDTQTHTHQSTHLSGLDPRITATLPVFLHKHKEAGLKDGSAMECSVCLSPIEEEEMVRLLPNCKHEFHALCIDKWLNLHSTCPICRTGAAPLLEEEQGELVADSARGLPFDSPVAIMPAGGSQLIGQSSTGSFGCGTYCLGKQREREE